MAQLDETQITMIKNELIDMLEHRTHTHKYGRSPRDEIQFVLFRNRLPNDHIPQMLSELDKDPHFGVRGSSGHLCYRPFLGTTHE